MTITAAFRKYDSVADSVADHSAYLLGATDGDGLRYPGLKGETDYRKAIQIIKDGVALDYSEEEATKILSESEVTALADIKMGSAFATAWGCDLTYDYVKINADYRS